MRFLLLLLALLVLAVAWRCRAEFRLEGAIWFDDPDTVRRLARIEASDASGWPLHEPRDGAPAGTVSHWTLPMDWFLRGIAPLGRVLFPQSRAYEGAALLAGPLLAALALVGLVLGLLRGSGAGWALFAGLLYTFNPSVLNVSWLGNGDHQNLQTLLVLGSWLAFWHALQGRRTAGLSGWLLGLAVWTSAESMLWVYLQAAIAVLWRPAACRGQALGLVLGLGLGHLCEHPTQLGALLWDQVSWFQLWQALVLLLFTLLTPRLRVLPAALLAAGVGLAPFAFAEVRAGFAQQLELARAADAWCQAEVDEYRSAFWDGSRYSLWTALDRFTWFAPALPVLAWFARRRELALVLAGTFALGLYEVKLAHLSAIPCAHAVALGMQALAQRYGHRAAVATAGAALGATLLALPAPPGTYATPAIQLSRAAERASRKELCAVLAARWQELGDGTVLAPWELGAHLIYYARVPVVASNYHRNLAGTLAGHRFFLAPAEDAAARTALQRERRVRCVVLWPNRTFFARAPRSLGTDTAYLRVEGDQATFTPAATASLYWQLRRGFVPAGWQQLHAGTIRHKTNFGEEPFFRVYALGR